VEKAPKAPTQDAFTWERLGGAWTRVRQLGLENQGATPLVFVHGFGSRLEAWHPIQQSISKERPTLSYDQRGFGWSERIEGDYGPGPHADDVLALIEKRGWSRAILVGHSYGAGVVLRAAAKAPERVAGIVLVDPFVLDEQRSTTFRWAEKPVLGELIFGAFYKEMPGEKYLLAFHEPKRFVSLQALDELKRMQALPGTTYASLQTIRGMDYRAHESGYQNLKAPLLILWGKADRVTPLSQMGAVLGRLPQAQTHIIEGAGHMPLWERPQDVILSIREFIAQHKMDPHGENTP
jgi:pimeloyl-ACP methyl ester carboxylesterase